MTGHRAPAPPPTWDLAAGLRLVYLVIAAAALVALGLFGMRAVRARPPVRWEDALLPVGLALFGVAGWLGPRRRAAYRALLSLSLLALVTAIVLLARRV